MVPGGGAFEVAAYNHLMGFKDQVKGKAKMGVQSFAESMLVIPKVFFIEDLLFNFVIPNFLKLSPIFNPLFLNIPTLGFG